jgi:hypothetical protein
MAPTSYNARNQAPVSAGLNLKNTTEKPSLHGQIPRPNPRVKMI